MNAEFENLSPQESLSLIQAMIARAKGNVQKVSFYFLLWGWVVVVANLGMFILEQSGYRHPYLVWLITIPAWVLSFIKTYSNRKQRGAVSHFDTITLSLWTCFGIVVITLVLFGFQINYQLNPLILLLTAIPTFVSGIILKFKPLVIGGILFWFFGSVSFLVPVSYQPLIGAIAIVLGYLVPGYLLKRKKD